MKFLSIFIILFFLSVSLYAQNPGVQAINILNNNIVKTPNSEVEDFLVWLQDVNKQDQPYIRCFTTYAIPVELREEAVLQLSFILHSMIGISTLDEDNAGAYYPLAKAIYKENEKAWDGKSIEYNEQQRVPNSDTLYWIDIRNYNWSEQSWENMTSYDGYMVEPIIQHQNNSLLRLISGNAMVRADWFIYHASSTTEQTDKNKKNVPIYRELLYSKTKSPKTVDEFRKAWGLKDITESRKLGNEYATLVTRSKNVARHNRLLFGYRTELGWLYQTYDVINEQGNRDYVDTFYKLGGKPPTVFDGGEIFATNAVQLQVYDLYNAEQKLVDSADASIVRHLSDILGDTRVSVPHSCYDCHAAGPIPSENTIAEFLKNNGRSYAAVKADQLRVDRAFYSNKFEESIEENQAIYAKSLLKVNGLLPEDNIKAYYKLINYYNKPVNIEQVIFECGVTKEILLEKAKEGLQGYNNKIPGRLALLLQKGESIPREIWEAPNTDGIPGTFQQTMIILNGLTQITTKEYVALVVNRCNIYSGGTTVIKEIQEGTQVKNIITTSGDWSYVELTDSTRGYIQNINMKRE